MYKIVVDFANGKTLEYEHSNLNKAYIVLQRYMHKRRPVVKEIRSYRDNILVETWDKFIGI